MFNVHVKVPHTLPNVSSESYIIYGQHQLL